jgi:raffinose/stachyose/melibiose transport system substrate-binding protein
VRRLILPLVAALLAGMALAQQPKTIDVWAIIQNSTDQTLPNMVKDFNAAHSDMHANLTQYQNDPYKQKLVVAMGANQGPDVFFGWGGGTLKEYVDAGKVFDLTAALDADPQWKARYPASVLAGATFDGKVYAVPINNVQPVFFYYNKQLFDQYGVSVPTTWDELLAAVKTFNQAGVAPIALGGASKWPDLMWEEYLVDRLGGPGAFNAAAAGQSGAWSSQAFIQANTMIQDLVRAGGFQKGFESTTQDSNAPAALLYTGRAAMELMGSWEYGTVDNAAPDFVNGGHLGVFAFPAVQGGAGDPHDIAGNLANYYSITSFAKNTDVAVQFLKDEALSDNQVIAQLKVGQVPAAAGISDLIDQYGSAPAFQHFVNGLVQDAPNFQLSWDQALSPALGQELLRNLDLLFTLQITPQQFSQNMDKAAAGG